MFLRILDIIQRRLLAYQCRTQDGYNAEKYWNTRHSWYKFNLRGVGNASRSTSQNAQEYRNAKQIFLQVCRQNNVDFEQTRFLDVGCGIGFYTQAIQEQGGKQYLGLDISDVLFPELFKKYPERRFLQCDISTQPLDESFDVILMIDVTQHIPNDHKFSFAMQNIKEHLTDRGVFIVTSWLDKRKRNFIYERSRDMDDYKKEFMGYRFSKPLPFRGKFIFTISKF